MIERSIYSTETAFFFLDIHLKNQNADMQSKQKVYLGHKFEFPNRKTTKKDISMQIK